MPAKSPSWTEAHSLGVLINAHMDHDCTLQELGNALGVTKQNAYHESVVALGKLTWALCERLQVSPRQVLAMLQRARAA